MEDNHIYKPILFNTEMVRAILDGKKTQTRRIINPQPVRPLNYIMAGSNHGKWKQIDDALAKHWKMGELPEISKEEAARLWTPPCHGNDILWVRETWVNLPVSPGGHTRLMRGVYYYKADVPDIRPATWRGNWNPSIHMPKEAARIFLRVTNVRAERLQDSFNDIVAAVENFKAEGIDIGETCENCIECYEEPTCRAYIDEDGIMTGECHALDGPRSDFSDLWDSTIKHADLPRNGWAANPWVWVIEFERIEGPPAMFFADRDTAAYADSGVLMPAT